MTLPRFRYQGEREFPLRSGCVPRGEAQPTPEGDFRGRYTYPVTAEVGRGTLGSWRDWHKGWFRRLGVPFGQGARRAIGGFVAGLEHSLGRPLHRRKPGPPAGHKRKRRYIL